MQLIDPRIAIWNAFHDGEITVIGSAKSELTIFVSIPYLRKRFEPLGDSFSLRLQGFSVLGFVDFEGKNATSNPDDVQSRGIEILSTDSEELPLKITTTQGYLTLDFENLSIYLDTGQQVEFEAVDRACRSYWDEFEKNARALQALPNQSTDPTP